MANLNINSLLKHINELRVIMADTPVQILSINEAKIDNSVSDNEIRINGYNIIRKDRNRKGGSVLMYIHESITFLERNDLCPDSLEMICVEITKPHNRSFLVISWYRAPNSNIYLFNDFESFLQNCEPKDYELHIMGDFNCDTDKLSPDHNTSKLLLLSALYQLDQLIN